jgi:hypothetical protein
LPSVNQFISQTASALVKNDTLQRVLEGRQVEVNEMGGTGTDDNDEDDLQWVRSPRPYIMVSAQDSPVFVPKFQMAPDLKS